MHTIEANDVRDALPQAVKYLMTYGIKEQTRVGEVLAAPNPVTIMYNNPKHHVLFSPIRDANPFFHLIEALWMLAGRHDGTFLDHYIKDFSKLFGNNGIIMDSYGFRWRYGLRMDQIDQIIAQLRKDPTSRQCVLQMWGAGVNDLMSQSAKPCNLIVTFRILDGALDMTVFNRSNDLVWGCCGANAVQFPILQEYVAARIGVDQGRYWQVSNNLHLYLHHIDQMQKRGELTSFHRGHELGYQLEDPTPYPETQQLVEFPLVFDRELKITMKHIEAINEDGEHYSDYISNPFLVNVVLFMAKAHRLYKTGDIEGSLSYMCQVNAEDWRKAGTEWIIRHDRLRRRHESPLQSRAQEGV